MFKNEQNFTETCKLKVIIYDPTQYEELTEEQITEKYGKTDKSKKIYAGIYLYSGYNNPKSNSSFDEFLADRIKSSIKKVCQFILHF